MAYAKNPKSTLLGYFFALQDCLIWVHPNGSAFSGIEVLFDVFRGNAIGDQQDNVVGSVTKCWCYSFQFVHIAGSIGPGYPIIFFPGEEITRVILCANVVCGEGTIAAVTIMEVFFRLSYCRLGITPI